MTSLQKIEAFLKREDGVPRDWKSLNKHKLDVTEWGDALSEAEERLDLVEEALREAVEGLGECQCVKGRTTMHYHAHAVLDNIAKLLTEEKP